MPIVTDGLTGRWEFKDGAGTTIADSAGAADGTLKGTVGSFWANTDRNGDTVGTFNGTSHLVEDFGLMFPAGSFSFSILCKIDFAGFADFRQVLRWQDSGGGTSRGFKILARNLGYRLNFGNGTTAFDLDFGKPRGWNQYVVLQVGWDGTNRFFRLQELEVTDATAGLAAPTTAGLQLSSNSGSTPFLNGRIAEVLFYDGKYLSPAERDQNFAALTERMRGSITITTPDAAVTKRVITLPSDGTATLSGRDNMSSQVWSTADKVLVSDSTDQGLGSIRNHLYRFSKTAGEMATTIDSGQDGTPYVGRTADDTHLGLGVGVDPAGRIHIGEHRHDDWRVLRSDTGLDVTAFTAVTDPEAHTADYTYTYFLTDGTDLYLRIQDRSPTTDGVYWWKWNNTTGVWEDAFGANPILRHATGDAGKVYAPFVTFQGSTIWACGSINIDNIAHRAEGPFVVGTVIRSTDGGSTWHNPSTGATVTLPATRSTADWVFPNSKLSGAGNWFGDQRGMAMTVDANGVAHFVCPWANTLEGDSATSLWYARWDATGKTYVLHRLLEHGAEARGVATIGIIGTTLFIIAPAQTRGATTPDRIVYLFTSDDGGNTWERNVVDTQVGNYVSEGNPDYRAPVVDSNVRYMPVYGDALTKAEVWEFDLPSGTSEGSASGAVAWVGVADGTTIREGSATGSIGWVGAADGSVSHEGASTGSISWLGSATGVAPSVGGAEGLATGTITWAGTATATTTHEGAAAEGIAWIGAADGGHPAQTFWTADPVGYTAAGVAYTPLDPDSPPPW